MRCLAVTISGLKCRLACKVGDFCTKHNPLNKLDDTTCAICLENISNPVKLNACTHVFCKPCISKAIIDKRNCPCCRAIVSHGDAIKLIKSVRGKVIADIYDLHVSAVEFPWKYERPLDQWTRKMRQMAQSYYEFTGRDANACRRFTIHLANELSA